MLEKVIIAIETSCDETSVAVLRNGEVLSNVIYSQLDLHAKYGGVVPSIARVAHQQKLPEVLEQAVNEAKINKNEIDYVAVTVGPGLAIALEVGLNYAKQLAQELNVPLIPINHMEGHLLSSFVKFQGQSPKKDFASANFPALGMLVSGNHSEFLIVRGVGEYEKIGETLDDACGEAFDKSSVMLGLGYPGGARISQLAKESSMNISLVRRQKTLYAVGDKPVGNLPIELPIPMALSSDLNMSYSGLKTAMKQLINELSNSSMKSNIRETGENVHLEIEQLHDVAKIFEFAAIEILLQKLTRALERNPSITQVWTGGGVLANSYLQQRLNQIAQEKHIEILIPEKSLYGDNAAMIGNAAHLRLSHATVKSFMPTQLEEIDRLPNLDFAQV